MPSFQIHNHFEAPPDYVRDWLTDLRPDDGQRYFGDADPATVKREGKRIVRDSTSPMGLQHTELTVESPTQWRAVGDVRKKGKVTSTFTIVESVRAEGEGTAHTVDGKLEGQTMGTRLLLGLMMPMMARSIRKAFVDIKADLEADYNAGRPATAETVGPR